MSGLKSEVAPTIAEIIAVSSYTDEWIEISWSDKENIAANLSHPIRMSGLKCGDCPGAFGYWYAIVSSYTDEWIEILSRLTAAPLGYSLILYG